MPENTPPRLTSLRIRNYRALRDVEFRDLTPLTVLIGANGSGKSTVLDALAFLGECMQGGLENAVKKRQGIGRIQTANSGFGGLAFQLVIQTTGVENRLDYCLKLEEKNDRPLISSEWLTYKPNYGDLSPKGIFSLSEGRSQEEGFNAYEVPFVDVEPELPVVGAFYHSPVNESIIGSIQRYQVGIKKARALIFELTKAAGKSRHIYFTDEHAEGFPDAVEQSQLSPTGDNLPNVLFYLKKKHPELLEELLAELRRRVPRLESITAEETIDKRLVLRLKDEAFAEPIPARFASDGTLRLLAYLVLLNEPEPAGLLGVEEPEAEIHPSLHGRLAEDFIRASARTQIFVATHSPQFLDALEPEQVWVLDRTPDGYTRATRAADIYNVKQRMDNGASLGALWLEGRLNPDIPRPPTGQ